MAGNDHVVAVVGPAEYRSYFQFAKSMDRLLERMAKDDITIISGQNPGTDYLVFLYALRRGLKHVMYDAKRLDFEAAVYRMQERMLLEATALVTVVAGYDRYVAQATRVGAAKGIPRRLITVKSEQQNGKESKKGHRSLCSTDIRTLSRYRERRSHSPFPGVNE